MHFSAFTGGAVALGLALGVGGPAMAANHGGDVKVMVKGLPASSTVTIKVTGRTGTRSITTRKVRDGGTLTNLRPGSYVVRSGYVSKKGVTYAPSSLNRWVTVAKGRTKKVLVRYHRLREGIIIPPPSYPDRLIDMDLACRLLNADATARASYHSHDDPFSWYCVVPTNPVERREVGMDLTDYCNRTRTTSAGWTAFNKGMTWYCRYGI